MRKLLVFLIAILFTNVAFAKAHAELVNFGVYNESQREFRYQIGVKDTSMGYPFDHPVKLEKHDGYMYTYNLEKVHGKLSEPFSVWLIIQEDYGHTLCDVKKTFNMAGILNPEIRFRVLSVREKNCDVIIESGEG